MFLEDGQQENNYINLTTQWMAENYDMLNKSVFNNQLGQCNFDIFTTGKGSQGHTLGWFRITGKNLKYNRRDRHLYKLELDGTKRYINEKNFFHLCQPAILLNGNYKWTYKAALSTLCHEMCHYYTYKWGYVPRQGHGIDFREIASVVSARSNDFFTVERLASAEQMTEMELDADIKSRNDARTERRSMNFYPTFVFLNNGNVELINSANMAVVNKIVNYHQKKHDAIKILCFTDEKMRHEVFKRYPHLCRTYRYWNLKLDDPLVQLTTECTGMNEYTFDEEKDPDQIFERKDLNDKLKQIISETLFKN